MNKSRCHAIEQIEITKLKPFSRNARTHSKHQIKQIRKSIERFGFTNPVLVDDQNGIVAGHGRVAAAREFGLQHIPCVRLNGMSDEDKRAYIIANRRNCNIAIRLSFTMEVYARRSV